ncbi:MAG: DUF2231 domain-containing protein, partial [Dehalococcoidia bacterium]
HPFFVHVPVVLIPVAALGFALTGWRREWRRWFIVPLLALTLAGAVFSVLAANSGEDLEERVEDNVSRAEEDRIEEHAEAGEMARNLSLLFAATAIGLGAVVFFDERKRVPAWAPLAVYAVVVVAGAGASIGMAVAGHSGAEAVWTERVDGAGGGSD